MPKLMQKEYFLSYSERMPFNPHPLPLPINVQHYTIRDAQTTLIP